MGAAWVVIFLVFAYTTLYNTYHTLYNTYHTLFNTYHNLCNTVKHSGTVGPGFTFKHAEHQPAPIICDLRAGHPLQAERVGGGGTTRPSAA